MNLLTEYIKDPTNCIINHQLGEEYEKNGHLASAVTHYLKAADGAHGQESAIYDALFRTSMIFKKAGGRAETVMWLLKRCISLVPIRAEAYLELLSYYDLQKRWDDCYLLASLAMTAATEYKYKEFPGFYAFPFYKGVAAWWLGNTEESRELIHDLYVKSWVLNDDYKRFVANNVQAIGYPEKVRMYQKLMYPSALRKFEGLEDIERNYAQSFQDLFALFVNKGKRNGFYLEIGSADPMRCNNTYLMEKDFGWTGISVDMEYSFVQKFRRDRVNPCLHADATQLDYREVLKNAPKTIDYLQVDCEPPSVSYSILTKMPFDDYKFNSITFEHDYYADKSIKDVSRAFLRSKGYKLVVGDVCFMPGKSYEDWWVHNSVPFASPNVSLNKDGILARDYMFEA